MKKFRLLVAAMWQPTILYFFAGLVLAGLLWYKLPTLVPGGAEAEAQARASANSLANILENPLYAPHKLLQYILMKTGHDGILAMRFVSTVFGVAIAWIFYQILRARHTPQIAAFGALLFSTSSWFLHIARLGTPDITFMLLVAALWCGLLLRLKPGNIKVLGISMLILISLCYVPGLIWFVLAGFIWQRKAFANELAHNPFWSGIFGAVGCVLLAPLIWSFVKDPSLVSTFMGLPEQLPSIGQFTRNLYEVPKAIFWSGLDDRVRWLPGTPLLDMFSAAMMIIGIYASCFSLRLDRVKLIVFALVGGTGLIALNGPIPTAILQPFVYLLIATGIAFMLRQWFTVFPRNPLARNLGMALMIIAIATSVFYQLNHYFIAWPQAPETKQAFMTLL